MFLFENVSRNNTDGRSILDVERTIKEQVKIEQMRFIVGGKDRVCCSGATGTRTTTDSMNEQFGFAREMHIHHIVQTGNVNTTSGNIRYNENRCLFVLKLGGVDLASGSIHRRVDEGVGNVCLGEQLLDIDYNVTFFICL